MVRIPKKLRELDPRKEENRGTVKKALTIAGGVAATVWVALQLRRELYGPGGTKLRRYTKKLDFKD